MARPRTSSEKEALFARGRQSGLNITEASKAAGVSYATGRRLNQRLLAQPQNPGRKPRVRMEIPAGPIPREDLSPTALDCLNDFARFRARFFGRISSPWQENAAQETIRLLETSFKEFVVLNCPPGSGKTTLFTHDIPAWLTVRNRAIRGLLGAVTQNIAERYTRRLRNTLARTVPMEADEQELSRGLALDADSVLAHDYGPLRPDRADQIPWANDQLTVVQFGETYSGEKEATWTAFGRNTEVISHRVNIMIWDDLVSLDRLRNEDTVKEDEGWWHDVAERRLEPYGLLLLQGQRLGSNDLYKHCKELTVSDIDIDDWDDDFNITELIGEDKDIEPESRPKYHQIVYKAHYNEYCKAKENPRMHSRRAAPFDPKDPEHSGCLLDPVRLSWREQVAEKDRPNSNYEVVYQQQDVDPKGVLVPAIWITGGTDEHGNSFPGCYDNARTVGQVPHGLSGTKLSIVTVDPAPAKFWSVQWWIYVEPPSVDRFMGQRYLIDMYRGRMDGPDLLDWNVPLACHTGLLADWQERARKTGFPINYLIVEKNGAQRFLMQYSWFRQWCSQNSVQLRPHNTQSNKADENFGVETIKNHYKFGRVSLPGTMAGRSMCKPLVKELTHYPDVTTTDCIMANWFMEFNLQHLVVDAEPLGSLYNDIPSWMNQRTANA
jgi:hypothetical protein